MKNYFGKVWIIISLPFTFLFFALFLVALSLNRGKCGICDRVKRISCWNDEEGVPIAVCYDKRCEDKARGWKYELVF